ncbi:hypothetical protein BH10BAC2_BH10BAC2_42920 [soil metagenome]
MNNKTFICLSICFTLIVLGCSKDSPVSQKVAQSEQESSLIMMAGEGTPISGNSAYAQTDECDYVSQGATYALKITGDLKGCIYAFVSFSECIDGYYWEEGREHFVGTYNGEPGEFWTTYRFLGKFEGCTDGATPSGAEIMGFCDHPLVKGSGTGAFEGATGRYYMIDNVKKGEFPYKGELKF